jgi:hypothetical protein
MRPGRATPRSPVARFGLHAALLAALLGAAAPRPAVACAFHTELPELSLSQHIAASVTLVAARPAAGDPFRFADHRLLKGTPPPDAPPQLVDAATRRWLAAAPGHAVLFARDANGIWSRLLLLDDTTGPLVDRMIARADAWTAPEGAAELRDTFAGLLAHPDEGLRRLALRELDALPYGVLRDGTYPVAAADLLRGIADIQDMPFAPIRILLLGLDGGSEPDAAITDRLTSLAESGADLHLGPWITAAVESGGPDGLAAVERQFLAAPELLSSLQLVEIIRALSVLSAQGDPALRAPLDRAIRRFVTLRPDAAPLIAQAFGAISDYSQIAVIRDAAAARPPSDRDQMMAVLAYVSRAGETSANSLEKRGVRSSSVGP